MTKNSFVVEVTLKGNLKNIAVLKLIMFSLLYAKCKICCHFLSASFNLLQSPSSL